MGSEMPPACGHIRLPASAKRRLPHRPLRHKGAIARGTKPPRRALSPTVAGTPLHRHPRRWIKHGWAFARAEPIALGAFVLLSWAILAFFELADDMREPDGQGFDWRVLETLRVTPGDPIGPKWLESAAIEITALGGIAVLFLLAAVLIGGLLLVKRRAAAAIVIIALLGGILISETLKDFFERTRPPEIYRLVEVTNESFPSGHALLSTVFYFTLGGVLASVADRRGLRLYALGCAALIALIVGATRIYLGAHWASDVLAGWCLGAAWALLCWLAVWFWKRRARRRGHALSTEELTLGD
jgi:undecaprenyl-diphosphatase